MVRGCTPDPGGLSSLVDPVSHSCSCLGAVPSPLNEGEEQGEPGAEREPRFQKPGSAPVILELLICLCLRVWRLWCLEQSVSRLGTLLLRCSVPLAGGVSASLPSCTSWESWKESPVSAPRRGEASEHQPQAAVPEKM